MIVADFWASHLPQPQLKLITHAVVDKFDCVSVGVFVGVCVKLLVGVRVGDSKRRCVGGSECEN